MITIKNLHKSYSNNTLFKKSEAIINAGDKVALLGQNGTGKSTLIKCINKETDYDGTISVNGRISIMEQEKTFKEVHTTFAEYLAAKKEVHDKKKKELEQAFGNEENYADADKYQHLLNEYETLSQRTQESFEEEELKKILDSLEFPLDLIKQPISALSGGEQTALRLAEALGRQADIIILDEPTNHLDFRALRWLEQHINESKKTFIVISHDRAFIDKIATQIIDIEDKKLITYNANYSAYLDKRKHHREIIAQQRENFERERERLLASSAQKREWAHKTGSRGMRIQADQLEARAQALPKLPDLKAQEHKYSFTVREGKQSSNHILSTSHLSINATEKVLLNDATISIYRGDKLAILGKNGAGKSSIIRALLGIEHKELHVTGSVSYGEGLRIGYLDQQGEQLPKNKKIMDYLLEKNAELTDFAIQRLAKQFDLDFDLRKKTIGQLSGGEKTRLQLIELLQGRYNLLVLDEPTNHLDLELCEALERALKEYKGTIIFISHDRYFVKKVATRIIWLENGKLNVLK